jgi:PKD repeat protein
MKGLQYIKIICAITLISFLSNCKKEDSSPVAAFSVDKQEAQIDEVLSFTNLSVNSTNYSWEFNDGSASTVKNPTHSYSESGTYTVSLEAIGSGGTNVATKEIEIIEPVNIYPGQSAMGIDLGEYWSTIEAKLSSGVYIWPIENFGDETNSFWVHPVEDTQNGIVLFMYAPKYNANISTNDYLIGIVLIEPYIGSTPEGLSLGHSKDKVYEKYGEPEEVDTENNGYYYLTKGIDFYFETDIIEEIDIYGSFKSTKSTMLPRSVLDNFKLFRKKL